MKWRREIFARVGIIATVALLSATVALKTLDLSRHAEYLQLPDPAFLGWRVATAVELSLLSELFVIGLLVSRVPSLIKGAACLWLACAFCFYHVIARVNQPRQPCPCFGHFLDAVGVSQTVLGVLTWSSLTLIAGVGLFLLCPGSRQQT